MPADGYMPPLIQCPTWNCIVVHCRIIFHRNVQPTGTLRFHVVPHGVMCISCWDNHSSVPAHENSKWNSYSFITQVRIMVALIKMITIVHILAVSIQIQSVTHQATVQWRSTQRMAYDGALNHTTCQFFHGQNNLGCWRMRRTYVFWVGKYISSLPVENPYESTG